MTDRMETDIACPQCGEHSAAEIWPSVNSADDPDAAQWLIDGFVFEHACPSCGNVSRLNYNCLYHDPVRNAMVQYVADSDKLGDVARQLAPYRTGGRTVRVVSTQQALREKAAILRDGLDDRAVELIKFLTFNKFVADGDIDARWRAYYGALDEDGSVLVEFIGREEPLETSVPRDLYENALRQIEQCALDDPQPLVVDRKWAADVNGRLAR